MEEYTKIELSDYTSEYRIKYNTNDVFVSKILYSKNCFVILFTCVVGRSLITEKVVVNQDE